MYVLVVRQVDIQAELQPVLGTAIQVGAHGVAVVYVAHGGTSLVELGCAHHVGQSVATAFERDIVLRLRIVELLVYLIPLGVVAIALIVIGLLQVSCAITCVVIGET